MQYSYTIHHAASKCTWDNVAYYDHVFRKNMEKNPERSWGKTYGDMWNIAMCDLKSASLTNNFGQGSKKTTGTCWKFNKGICKAGQHCRYPHRCTYCGGTNHGAHNCFKKGRKSENNRDTRDGRESKEGKSHGGNNRNHSNHQHKHDNENGSA